MACIGWEAQFKRLEGAYAPSTMRGYYADIRAFVNWCEEHGVSPFPAQVGLVCQFLDHQAAAGLAISSIRRRMYALRKAHNLLLYPDPTREEDVNLTFRRIRRASFARPAQAKGLTKDFLQQFLDGQPHTPWGLRNRTMLSLGYDLLTRRAELVALKDRDLEPRRDGTYRCVIRRSKADPFGNGRTAFCSRRSAALVAEWRAWRGPDVEWLFCPIYSGKAINRSLSPTTVKRLVKSAAARADLDPDMVAAFSGHSLRVGAAQDLLASGHDTAAIMRAGGWKSINVLGRYLENAEHNVWL
ncbi:tyrosine-type recombinase/integrase [Paracoccus tibetensis]|uniref:Site-specific recombinase XerD n=1 Tax=Paracoccus tibetensis TaxID=336292 RepID=A0A1G5DQK7_9RHOB|nr:tyrosine-type recombinase/integrase [Paracoccus tibetensis]SCY16975.1 Site-specific recombinase XerD [Paracoccus tibetensis]